MGKKLIEVALPLDEINAAGAREKSVRHGHPSTLHLWWSRKPLAVARAVIFAQTVDDPSEYVDVLLSDPPTKRAAQRALRQRQASGEQVEANTAGDLRALREVAAEQERERLFGILRELVRWENTTNETVLERARTEIWQSWRRACAQNADQPKLFDREKLPAFHDPFAGGGALPRGAKARPRGSRERPESCRRVDQQGDDRGPAPLRGPGAGEPGSARRGHDHREDVEWGAGAGRGRAALRPVDA